MQEIFIIMQEEKMDALYRRLIGLRNYFDNEEGQALVEYALILVLIAIVVILMLTGMGSSVNNTFSQVNSALN